MAKRKITLFRDLAIGAAFKFPPSWSQFDAVCLKVSTRCYTWRNRHDGSLMRASVGTINCEVIPAEITAKVIA